MAWARAADAAGIRQSIVDAFARLAIETTAWASRIDAPGAVLR
jgi:hypothetical protein